MTSFSSLYPDIDPTTPIRPRISEKVALSVATGVLCWGLAAGNLIIGGVGAALFLFATIGASQQPLRRVRAEARSRFPEQPWAENTAIKSLHLPILVPLWWVLIGAVAIICLLWVPSPAAEYIAAIFGAVAMWFMPGMCTLWHRLRKQPQN